MSSETSSIAQQYETVEEERKRKKREYAREWRKKNLDKSRSYWKNWKKKNPDKVRVINARYQKKHYDKLHSEEAKRAKSVYNKQYRIKNPDTQLKFKYGISGAERDALFSAQGYACAICNTTDPGKRGWCVDHDHDTEQVRNILCHYCNIGLGNFKDNPALLLAAAAYLERFKNGGQEQETAG